MEEAGKALSCKKALLNNGQKDLKWKSQKNYRSKNISKFQIIWRESRDFQKNLKFWDVSKISQNIYFVTPERLRRAYPAPLGRAGVGSIPANPRRTKRAFFPPLAIWNEA
jgi:hypothetical protein